jgi:hypothetical protein
LTLLVAPAPLLTVRRPSLAVTGAIKGAGLAKYAALVGGADQGAVCG